MPDQPLAAGFESLIGELVVVDVASPFIFLGTLAAMDGKYLVLTDADAHDLRDTSTTRDLYTIDAKRHGINVNRRRLFIDRTQIVSVSALSDIVE